MYYQNWTAHKTLHTKHCTPWSSFFNNKCQTALHCNRKYKSCSLKNYTFYTTLSTANFEKRSVHFFMYPYQKKYIFFDNINALLYEKHPCSSPSDILNVPTFTQSWFQKILHNCWLWWLRHLECLVPLNDNWWVVLISLYFAASLWSSYFLLSCFPAQGQGTCNSWAEWYFVSEHSQSRGVDMRCF